MTRLVATLRRLVNNCIIHAEYRITRFNKQYTEITKPTVTTVLKNVETRRDETKLEGEMTRSSVVVAKRLRVRMRSLEAGRDVAGTNEQEYRHTHTRNSKTSWVLY
jgi:hypothetical protein